jgi:iron(III) transport system permease protein
MSAADHAATAPRFDQQWLILAGVIAFVAWLALVPLAFLIWQSVSTTPSFGQPAQFTLSNYANVYSSASPRARRRSRFFSAQRSPG